MHDIVLPRSRLKRLKNSYRYPGQAALVARIPLLGRRVPMRAMWRREPLGLARRAERYVTAQVGGPSLLAGICGGLGKRGRALDAVRGAVPQAMPAIREAGSRIAPRIRDEAKARAKSLPSDRIRKQAGAAVGRARELARRDVHVPVRLPEGALPGISTPLVHLGDVHAHRRLQRPRMNLVPAVPAIAAGAAAGALVMYYADPQQGRRRRALVRDKLARARNIFTREVPERASRRMRFFSGVAKGVGHNAMDLVRPDDGRIDDDETLVARVRSEALRDPRFKPGEIHVEAYEGCVTLRGQLDDPRDIERLVNQTKAVEGVREVRSYLHLPDTLPPNKADVYRASEAHLPAM